MDKQYMMEMLINIVRGMSKLMGDNTEIVLYDLDIREIIFIENEHITGRKKGDQIHPKIITLLEEHSDAEGHIIGYRGNSKTGKKLKCSHFMIKDKLGKPFALICINQDIYPYVKLRDEIDNYIKTIRLANENNLIEDNDNNIQKITEQIITDEIELAKPLNLNSKESKMKIIRRLDNKGVFLVKDAVIQVCEILSISQATLYNYQREIRAKEKDYSQQDVLYKMLYEK